jgi:N-acetylmuramoyl-L-alanine amidase
MRQLICPFLRAILSSTKTCRGSRLLYLILITSLFLLCYSAFGSSETAKINDVRIADRQSVTRVVFDLSSAVNHHVFVLKDPDRVVLDIENCDVNGKLETSGITGTLLKGMRYAQKSKEKMRIVFDLNTTVAPKSFLLAPSKGKDHRLVIDLLPTTPEKQAEPVLAMQETPINFRDVIIAVDAGHGGKDPGATGRAGSREKVLVLSIAKRLGALIDRERGMKAVLIRDRDTFVSLRGRIKKASKSNADVFISIHADAAVDRRARGSSVYVLSQHGATSEATRILAQRANEADKIGGVSLGDKDEVLKSVLVDLSQTATIDASIDLAEDVLRELNVVGKVLRNRVEQAGFAVLKSPDIPSVLVEVAFISNAQEEKRLKSGKHQQALAQAILKGVQRYLKDRAPSESLLANLGNNDIHTIRHGETLSGIAHHYQVSIVDLRRVNELKTDMIRIGQVLTIPTSVGT